MNIEALGELADKGLPPWLKWLGALLVMAFVVAAIYAYGQQQYGRGEKAESARWLARENADLVKANAEITRLTKEKSAQETAHQARMAKAAADYQQEKKREQAKTEAVLADLRAGNAGLWYHLASGEGAAACGEREAIASPGGSHAGTTAQLPGTVAAYLYAEADRADGIVRQLQLCQQVIIEDRRLCGQHQER